MLLKLFFLPGFTCLFRVGKNVPPLHDRHGTGCHRLRNMRQQPSSNNTVSNNSNFFPIVLYFVFSSYLILCTPQFSQKCLLCIVCLQFARLEKIRFPYLVLDLLSTVIDTWPKNAIQHCLGLHKNKCFTVTLGAFSISTKHMRQFPATDRRSW